MLWLVITEYDTKFLHFALSWHCVALTKSFSSLATVRAKILLHLEKMCYVSAAFIILTFTYSRASLTRISVTRKLLWSTQLTFLCDSTLRKKLYVLKYHTVLGLYDSFIYALWWTPMFLIDLTFQNTLQRSGFILT